MENIVLSRYLGFFGTEIFGSFSLRSNEFFGQPVEDFCQGFLGIFVKDFWWGFLGFLDIPILNMIT